MKKKDSNRSPSRRALLGHGTLALAGVGLASVLGSRRARADNTAVRPNEPGRDGRLVLPQADWVSHVAFAPSGSRLATTSYLLSPAVYLWDLATGALLQKIPRRDQGCRDFLFTPDGNRLVVLGEVNPYHDKEGIAFQLFELSQGKLSGSFALGRRAVSYAALSISPDNRMLAALIDRVGPHPQGVELWELATRRLLATLPLGTYDFVDRIAYSPDGTELRGYAHRQTVTWRLDTKTPSLQRYPDTDGLGNAFFARSGKRCLLHMNAFPDKTYDREKEYNRLRAYDTDGYKLLWQLDGLKMRALRRFDFSPDGSRLALSCHATPLRRRHMDDQYADDVGYEVFVYELSSGAVVCKLPQPGVGPQPVALPKRPNEEVRLSFSPDGKRLALHGWDKAAWVLPLP